MVDITEHDILKALSEPTRLRIVSLLSDGSLCVCQLIDILDLPQSTISRHLYRLRMLGLAKDRRMGRRINYALTNESHWPLAQLRPFLNSLRHREPYRSDLMKRSGLIQIGSCPTVTCHLQ